MVLELSRDQDETGSLPVSYIMQLGLEDSLSKNCRFITLYHGTSYDHVNHILKKGLHGKRKKTIDNGYYVSMIHTLETANPEPQIVIAKKNIARTLGKAIIRVKIPVQFFWKHFDEEIMANGQRVFSRHGEGTLVPPSYLSLVRR